MLVLGLAGHFSPPDVELAPGLGYGYAHDAAACLIRDGELVAAVEEERLNRVKKTTKFPINAIRACLATAGVAPSRIDAVGHYVREDFLDIALGNVYAENPRLPLRSSRELITGHLSDGLGIDVPSDRLLYNEHHVCHAMSSFVRSGMEEALVVVMDFRGELHSTTIFLGREGRLERLAAYGLEQSLGRFYENHIKLLGYRLGDEYKVMGLAPYGNPDTYRGLFSSMYTLRDNGDFDLNTNPNAFLMNGFLPRRRDEEFTERHRDFAAGLQAALEELATHVIAHWAEHTGITRLCFVGGVAHNSSLNGLLLRSGRFTEIFVHPVSHDAGAAEGAALGAADLLGASRPQPRLRSASVGPGLGTANEIEKQLAAWGDLIEYAQPADIVAESARLLADGAVLGWAQGRSEYGPRALGNRSILADPRPAGNKQRINSMVKKREAYRPFAPVVTREAAAEYFDLPARTKADYEFMSFVVNVREDRRAELGAVTHVDGSARLQIVDPDAAPRFHRLVRAFGELTGTPVLLNTSFNNNAEPIVQDVRDALTCFLTTGIDYLVVEDFLVRRRRDGEPAIDGLIPEFRPVARLVKRVRTTVSGKRDVVHEIFMDVPFGARTQISAGAFAVLEAADGARSLASLADAAGGLDADIRAELYRLWQGRFFLLRPE
ncbi:carbamoyltransferase [Actinomadura sp. LD22]|uniref:Carbamoyltransferase n=1 Tax=Actinomadura physcomitrii TaxID=2650748 RepID=A0A6I4MRP0_9ACTN|nr:carbamoyltransferase C-terminal domain-containing protein [Actinomadura physcomitrii]MWA04966.1 carbamoyltransferase [Actinomadura physcomitrii]